MLSSDNICVLIHHTDFNEEALDFILAASNLTENITVIFTKESVNQRKHFKALKGFGIQAIYVEENQISHDTLKQYVAHSQQIFAF